MTVTELIEALRQFPPGLPVYIPGRDTSVDDVEAAEPVQVARDISGHTWFGRLTVEHQLADIEGGVFKPHGVTLTDPQPGVLLVAVATNLEENSHV